MGNQPKSDILHTDKTTEKKRFCTKNKKLNELLHKKL